jgi:protein-tyrosine phosphatase
MTIDFSEIEPHIFIGNVYSVIGNHRTKESDILDTLKIDIVISILSEDEYESHMITHDDFPEIEWHRLVTEDDEAENIFHHFLNTYSIINRAVHKNKNVIVHCAAGISRSPTLVIAYLMIKNNWTYNTAYKHVKNKRAIVKPNAGFVHQLKMLETALNV